LSFGAVLPKFVKFGRFEVIITKSWSVFKIIDLKSDEARFEEATSLKMGKTSFDIA
jgi:hypothetical protein